MRASRRVREPGAGVGGGCGSLGCGRSRGCGSLGGGRGGGSGGAAGGVLPAGAAEAGAAAGVVATGVLSMTKSTCDGPAPRPTGVSRAASTPFDTR